jgi:hypothetical protein
MFIQKKTPDRLSLTSEQARFYDLYTVRFFPEENKNYLLESKEGNNGYTVFKWDENGVKSNAVIDINTLNYMPHQITHYFKGHILTYNSITEYIVDKFLKMRRVRLIFLDFKSKTSLYLFYRKKLAISNRMELLNLLIEDHISSGSGYRGKTKFAILSLNFNMHWILHPDKERLSATINLYLDSFIIGGELIKINNSHYKVTGKALETYAKHIEEEQRHQQSIGQQKKMVYLTIAISLLTLITAISALGQANIISFPVWINLK